MFYIQLIVISSLSNTIFLARSHMHAHTEFWHKHTYSGLSTETLSAVWVLTWDHTDTYSQIHLWTGATLSLHQDLFWQRAILKKVMPMDTQTTTKIFKTAFIYSAYTVYWIVCRFVVFTIHLINVLSQNQQAEPKLSFKGHLEFRISF